MTRRGFYLAASTLAFALVSPASLPAQDRAGRPNVVYMMLNEIGYFELSCLGHRILKTPHVDRVAAEGMRFTQCLAGGLRADALPTLAEACGAKVPGDIDGLSFLPTLLGKGGQRQHDFLYWEYGDQVAVRKGNWKAYKSGTRPWQLFGLATDTLEEKDLAAGHPDVLKSMTDYATSAHAPAAWGTWIDESKGFVQPRKAREE